MSDDFKRVESHDCPMSTCAAPAGSPCRTGKGKVAIQYHTARFRLVPQLAKALSVPAPAVRKPGPVGTELPRPVNVGAEPVGHVRLGYARASTARQSLDAQLDSLAETGVTRVFSEKISTRAAQLPKDDGPRALADVVLREAEGRLSVTIEGTVRCVQNRARLVRALYERLDRLEAARPQAG
ncbi:zinc finger domain-containing protein [Streptomyces sparsogenes]|uniref:zinc finger domain-containing protein n=1 Tax=Streptomyces sparsogenes TaxID=67365 RepID=UPI003F4CB4FC